MLKVGDRVLVLNGNRSAYIKDITDTNRNNKNVKLLLIGYVKSGRIIDYIFDGLSMLDFVFLEEVELDNNYYRELNLKRLL